MNYSSLVDSVASVLLLLLLLNINIQIMHLSRPLNHLGIKFFLHAHQNVIQSVQVIFKRIVSPHHSLSRVSAINLLLVCCVSG